jgi:tRNA-binding EMAP/Myf-like protein
MNGLVVLLCNIKKRKLGGADSHGMLLCAGRDEMVDLLRPHICECDILFINKASRVGELLYIQDPLNVGEFS